MVQANLLDPKTKDWKLKVKLLEEPQVVPSGFYKASNYKLGSIVETTTKLSAWTFKKGNKVTLQWQSYSGMGENGAIGGLSWNLLSKP